ncbi:hypothetical protein MLD38_010345 [Melastoma candidum]|uniref:Uncharacterized protein n=1 Tax=Melastoma candidum TaxID=119954 RepID=A0ACB9R0U2_9MYRT|nr:hypothetical protein MLD38_010345 [Melastoma candidum]
MSIPLPRETAAPPYRAAELGGREADGVLGDEENWGWLDPTSFSSSLMVSSIFAVRGCLMTQMNWGGVISTMNLAILEFAMAMIPKPWNSPLKARGCGLRMMKKR